MLTVDTLGWTGTLGAIRITTLFGEGTKTVDPFKIGEAFQVQLDARGIRSETAVGVDGVLRVRVVAPGSPPRVLGGIEAWSEVFFLYLTDGFEFREFDWEESGQLQIVETLSELFSQHAKGYGQIELKSGIFGRKLKRLTFTIGDDKLYGNPRDIKKPRWIWEGLPEDRASQKGVNPDM